MNKKGILCIYCLLTQDGSCCGWFWVKVWRGRGGGWKSLFCFAQRPGHALPRLLSKIWVFQQKFYQLTNSPAATSYKKSPKYNVAVQCLYKSKVWSDSHLSRGLPVIERAVFPVFWKPCAAEQDAVRCPRSGVVRSQFLKQLCRSAACTRDVASQARFCLGDKYLYLNWKARVVHDQNRVKGVNSTNIREIGWKLKSK